MSTRRAQYWANRYYWATGYRADIDMEDLLQAALMGEYIAQSKYSPDKGAFSTFSAFYIQNEIRDLIGIKHGKVPPPTISLDEPISEESDETRLDLLADETLPDMADAAYTQERKEGVRAAVDRIKDQQQRDAIRLCYLEGKGAKEIGEALGICPAKVYKLFEQGRSAMRKDKLLQQLTDIDIPYYVRIGVETFQSTGISAVEFAALYHERELEKLTHKIKA